jgi:hypothetical protein
MLVVVSHHQLPMACPAVAPDIQMAIIWRQVWQSALIEHVANTQATDDAGHSQAFGCLQPTS